MPIFIRNPRLDSRLEKLAKRQPVPAKKHPFIEAVLNRALDACDQTGNPEAWREIGPSPASTAPPPDASSTAAAPSVLGARPSSPELSSTAQSGPTDGAAFTSAPPASREQVGRAISSLGSHTIVSSNPPEARGETATQEAQTCDRSDARHGSKNHAELSTPDGSRQRTPGTPRSG